MLLLELSGGDCEAGIALGFTRLQRLRRIVVPQALPRMIPPLGNLAIELLKATALVSPPTLWSRAGPQALPLRRWTVTTP